MIALVNINIWDEIEEGQGEEIAEDAVSKFDILWVGICDENEELSIILIEVDDDDVGSIKLILLLLLLL